jgi:hypothetical protein
MEGISGATWSLCWRTRQKVVLADVRCESIGRLATRMSKVVRSGWSWSDNDLGDQPEERLPRNSQGCWDARVKPVLRRQAKAVQWWQHQSVRAKEVARTDHFRVLEVEESPGSRRREVTAKAIQTHQRQEAQGLGSLNRWEACR